MSPPYNAYQQQQGYGQYGQEYANMAYGQPHMSPAQLQAQAQAHAQAQSQQRHIHNQASYPAQQQSMVAPSVSNFQQQPVQWQAPQQNYDYNYNYQPQLQPQLARAPSQHRQSYQNPHHQQPATYQQASPLQQFAAGQLQDPGQQRQQQPQYWQPQQASYIDPQRLSMGQQRQSVQHKPQAFVPDQRRQSNFNPSSPMLDAQANLTPSTPASVSGQRPQQQNPASSQPQQYQSPQASQRQQLPPDARPQHATPSVSQHHPQYQQHTPSQPPSQRQPLQPYQTGSGIARQPPAPLSQTPRKSSQPLQQPSSTPNSRTFTHVQIPAHNPVDMAPTPSPHSQKRRRSNEGKPINVSQPQKHQLPPQSAYVQIPRPPESSPLTELASSQVVPPTPSPDVDYQSVLLSLSDEYMAAAHSMSAHLYSTNATEEDLEQYHQLVATALGCLEAIIVSYRPSDARKEARIRLRFATILFEETENTTAAEESLSKSIAFCERHKLMDNKYAMHHLLVRVIFKTNPTAAIRTLEKLIQEVDTLGATLWVYAFRFLRVSLSVQSNRPSDTSNVLRHLAAVNELANSHQHVAVQITAACLDALVHLHSGDPMATELASRSLAAARTHQLGDAMAAVPQLSATVDLLDIACAFMQSTAPDQCNQKVAQLHADLEKTTKDPSWTADGSFLLPLNVQDRGKINIEAETGGVFRRTPSGEVALAFMWLSRGQLYMLGYLLGAIAKRGSNTEEQLLESGLKFEKPIEDASEMSIKTVGSISELHQGVVFAIKLLQIYTYCGRAAWKMAMRAIDALQAELKQHTQYQDEYTKCSLMYLTGVCKQALGEDRAALDIYRRPELSLRNTTSKSVTPIRDLQALSALNAVSIMRSLPTESGDAEQRLADLGPYCESNPNKGVVSAYHILRAYDPDPAMTIIKIKQCLQAGLKPAQAVKNSRILSIIMNTMTGQFFTGIVGKQSINSASAGRTFAIRSQDPLWIAVGDGLCRDVLMRNGDVAGAAQAEQHLKLVMEKVPENVRAKLAT